MQSFRILDGQSRYLVAAATLLIATFISALMPVVAGAEQVTARSIAPSSSVAGATGATYEVKFTAPTAAGAIIVDFCEGADSPLYGEACDAPAGFSLSGATVPTTDYTDESVLTGNKAIRVTSTITQGEAVSFEINGVANPSAAGTIYARIVTFDTAVNADDYISEVTDPVTENVGKIDDGGIAMAFTNGIGVSGTILESMTFCVSGASITANCGGVTTPTVKLGATVGDQVVLDAADTYEGTIYTQISTNAASGAIVSLKSSTAGCGGLARAGAGAISTRCGIEPALAGGVADGSAKFGVKIGTPVGVGTNFGTFRAFNNAAYYNDTDFKFNYVAADATGVTSTYGDPFLDTNDAPISNMNMPVTFAASAANNTPAGRYSADLSMIATGRF